MAKNKNDYFKLIEQQVTYCVEASNLLEEILCNFNHATIADQRNKMHEIENAADKIHHHILSCLSVEFITPVDQEDILRLVQIIDDITDALDDVVLDFYMFHIDQVPEGASELSKVVNRCVTALLAAAKELKNFKKPDALRAQLVKVNDIECEGDAIYIESIHMLFANPSSEKTLLGTKAIYDSLEHCCDLCEHAADVIEQVIIKNT